MHHKFESQLHFRLHWHLKLDFMVNERDAVLEVTQDNLNPSLSMQKLFPSTEGNSVCPSLYNYHPVSPSFIHFLTLAPYKQVLFQTVLRHTLNDAQWAPRSNLPVLGTNQTLSASFWSIETTCSSSDAITTGITRTTSMPLASPLYSEQQKHLKWTPQRK